MEQQQHIGLNDVTRLNTIHTYEIKIFNVQKSEDRALKNETLQPHDLIKKKSFQ